MKSKRLSIIIIILSLSLGISVKPACATGLVFLESVAKEIIANGVVEVCKSALNRFVCFNEQLKKNNIQIIESKIEEGKRINKLRQNNLTDVEIIMLAQILKKLDNNRDQIIKTGDGEENTLVDTSKMTESNIKEKIMLSKIDDKSVHKDDKRSINAPVEIHQYFFSDDKAVEILAKLLGAEPVKPQEKISSLERKNQVAFWEAARVGNTKKVKILLGKKDVNLNALDREGNTALIMAASNGHAKVVETLLCEKGIDRTIKNNDGFDALEMAAKKRHSIIPDMLMNSEAPKCTSDDGEEDTQKLAEKEDSKKIEKSQKPLLYDEQKNQINNKDLWVAARSGLHGKVKELLEKGANVNAKNYYDTTALMMAAYRGHTNVVKTLLGEGGIDELNAQDKDGDTALMFAAREGHRDVYKKLIKADANPKKENIDGKTALEIAKERRKIFNSFFEEKPLTSDQSPDDTPLVPDRKSMQESDEVPGLSKPPPLLLQLISL